MVAKIIKHLEKIANVKKVRCSESDFELTIKYLKELHNENQRLSNKLESIKKLVEMFEEPGEKVLPRK